MSFLTIPFGQCGNQVGETLYSTIYEDTTDKTQYFEKSLNKWFNVQSSGKLTPRSILIDTEVKVINNRKSKPYEFKNIIVKPLGGCANNWAFGYNLLSDGITDVVLDKVRSEIETCDYFLSFLNILGSSGGTGSGIGSKVIEELRNEHPNKLILNTVILPYLNGEIVTQNYNTLLSLAKLHEVSDVQILFENDELHELCTNSVNHSLNFTDLNRLIAFQLASTLQPIENENNAVFLSHAASHPIFKYLHLRSSFVHSKSPKFGDTLPWKSLLNKTIRKTNHYTMLQRRSPIKINEKIISSVIITRGQERPKSDDFESLKLPVSWTDRDKRDLLVALETHGPSNLDAIQQYMPHKSVMEIRCIIEKYKQMAHVKAQKSDGGRAEETPLNQWIKIMQDLKLQPVGVEDLYPRILKYIALFENHSKDAGVDLRECYLAISELMKGESIKNLDPYTSHFLYGCLTDLAEKIKQGDNTDMVDFVKSIDNLDDLAKANFVKSYSKNKKDFSLNPLRVPDNLLKLTQEDLGEPSTSSQP